MKKFLFLSIIISFSHIACCQSVQTDYLKKSKKQKAGAWILVGSGTAIIVVGTAFVVLSDALSFYDDSDLSDLGIGLIVAGGVVGASSIPLFIASAKNKNKSLSLSLKNEPIPWIQNYDMVSKKVYGIAIKYSF